MLPIFIWENTMEYLCVTQHMKAVSISLFLFFFFFKTEWHVASYFPDQGLNPPAVEVRSINHWTARESSYLSFRVSFDVNSS